MALGAVVVTVGSQIQLSADLTSKGTYVGTVEPQELMWAQGQVVLPAAMEASNGMYILGFGMLMMLIGFGLHAWMVVEKRDDESAPVKKKKVKKARPSRRQAEVIWIERTYRF